MPALVSRLSTTTGDTATPREKRCTPATPPSWRNVIRPSSVPERSNRIEVVGGWLPGKGNRTNQLGALLLGQPAASAAGGQEREIEFIGAVGTGWTLAITRQLLQQLTELHTQASPFNTVLPREYTRDAHRV
jgi:hypothetical protein